MGFTNDITNVDYGTTEVENIFINEYMPLANGTYVKVYLYSFKIACDMELSKSMDNKKLARQLNLSLSDVVEAWDYWEKTKIVNKIKLSDEIGDFDVVFISLRQLYIESNYEVKKSTMKTNDITSQDISRIKNDPEIAEMFRDINQIMRRHLKPQDQYKIIGWMDDWCFSPEIILKAFLYAVEEKGKKNLNYISAILSGWYDDGLVTTTSVNSHLQNRNEDYVFYRKIYSFYENPKSAIQESHIEDFKKWLFEYKFTKDFIIFVVTDKSKSVPNLNLKYLNATMDALHKKGISTVEAYENQDKPSFKQENKSGAKFTTITSGAKNKFHNFKQREANYTAKELKAILDKKNRK